ncbi:MAG: gliding motility-associated C-terminal domain-containing protein, partial [Flavisolibacter sp.]
VVVTPNTNYNFSIWTQSVSAPNPASLQFSINNIKLGNTITANSSVCQWQQFSSAWNSGNNTSATITIVNTNTVAAGNDFALDDIYFGEVTTKTDSLKVNVTGLCDSVKLTGINKVCSPSDTLTYSIYKSPACTQQYSLLVDNAFATIVSQTANSIKLYFTKNGKTTIKVAYANSCKIVLDSMDVDIKFSPKTINVGPDIVSCRDTAVLLHAGNGFNTYLWHNGSTDSLMAVTTPGTYSVQAQNLCGVFFKDTFQLVKTSPLPFAAAPANATVCKSDSVQFTASGGTSYSWQPAANFNLPNNASSKALVDVTGFFTVSIIDAACIRDTLITIPVKSNPGADINLSKSNDVNCGNDSAILKVTGGVSYSWSPNLYITRSTDGQITVKPPVTQTYVVTGKDASGCVGVDSVTVSFTKTGDQQLFMPSAFTPNGDGLNEVFRPTFIGPAANYDFRVYNRWGQLLFRSKTPGAGWDGYFNSIPQPKAVYVYYIKADGGCNGKFERKGTFALIK